MVDRHAMFIQTEKRVIDASERRVMEFGGGRSVEVSGGRLTLR